MRFIKHLEGFEKKCIILHQFHHGKQQSFFYSIAPNALPIVMVNIYATQQIKLIEKKLNADQELENYQKAHVANYNLDFVVLCQGCHTGEHHNCCK